MKLSGTFLKIGGMMVAIGLLAAAAFAAARQDSPPQIVRKSSSVLAASATKRVEPEYPAAALSARLSGSVVVEVVVDEGGKVISARALSGHPLFKDAAVTAAQQWEFTPTQVSGTPVKVIGTLTLTFQHEATEQPDVAAKEKRKADANELAVIDVLKEEANKNPNSASTHYSLARAYARLGRYPEAVESAKKALKLDPQNADVYNSLGWYESQLGQLDDAIQAYTQAVTIKPDFALAHHNLGWAYFKLGAFAQAAEIYKRLIEMNPNYELSPRVLSELAQTYGQLNNYQEAMKAFEQALKLNPDDAMVLNNLGYFLLEHNEKFDKALEMIQRAVQMEPNNEAFLDSLGWAYFKMGRLEEADHYLSRAASTTKSAAIHEHLGDLHDRLGRKEAARAAYQKALSLAVDSGQKSRLENKVRATAKK